MEKEAFEPTGLIPRSIIRTVDRFVQQLLPGREKIALQEYRVSRYQILVSIKSLSTLVLIPIVFSSTIKRFVFTPSIEHFWNSDGAEIFLNRYQEKRAFQEMHDFREKMFFEALLIEPRAVSEAIALTDARDETRFQMKSLELATSYNKQSVAAITNLLGDFVAFFVVVLLFRIMRPELIISKSFLTESLYSLSDTTKSFLLILGMDLLVGFHSPRGWELALELSLRHVGLPENENFILLFVALFPVFLDTVFKYWIFRYLNKISPSTVVTYHSMIE